MSSLTPTQVAMKWAEAYNRHDADSVTSLYDEDIINIQLPYEKSVEGRATMLLTYQNIFKAFPDIHLQIENIIEGENSVAVEWLFSGTMKGAFAGHAPNSKTFKMRGCEIFQVANGKILIQHGYWDKTTMFDQLGIS